MLQKKSMLQIRCALLHRAEFETLAKAAGFQVLTFSGDSTYAPFQEETRPSTIWVLGKELSRSVPMARNQARPPATKEVILKPLQTTCRACGSQMRMARHSHRTVTTLQGVTHLTLQVYRCRSTTCPRFHQATRPEEEGRWAIPHGEFGLDVIALVGTLRYQQQRSIPQIHEELLRRGLQVAQRTVTDQLYRYEELLALHLADSQRFEERLRGQKQVILSLDGLQPDVGHEVLWVLRDCCSGEVLGARSMLGATQNDLVPLLEQAATICQKLDIPIAGVITDGQRSIRNAVARA